MECAFPLTLKVVVQLIVLHAIYVHVAGVYASR